MFDQKTSCPYTGLRSFNEEEAIYFKGRDQHIEEASKQLEERKFLMLTGSSGDGKSSLVYAGIVPFARAGFIKSSFTNWLVADFKPERHPFKNLCESMASRLEIPSVSTVEAELSHGYSSLVELYKNSKYYVDQNSIDWLHADDNQQRNLKRHSANLLILADQFEEFFTNPENYFKGVTSQESNLVVNLLLETARIAREENLPIYVVCTMRSDYIGQCAAFRGLPEYIGYSQFFVPRLNRKQLLEVIEEPAILSGNRISKRLTERLIHDITEGVDQLPILQHALNQIWRAAEQGEEEMDLIHYAMVGGMSGNDLPDQDKDKFSDWFDRLPQKIQNCYEEPNLQNVLNTHANKLYATAADAFNQDKSDPISEEDARHLMHNVFVCLTKMDHGRAVRNRMSLQEITDITDIDGLTPEKVKGLTAIFRDPGNTLIQPFIDDEGNDPLGEEDLLDITHESLIRNWNVLKTWATEEYHHVNTYEDYKHQVDRWIENNRSSDYLLPIGTLTHFEDWFKEIEPNKYWINRYNQEIEDKEERLNLSEEILDDCNTYLKASAQKHFITRSVMKLGARKIAMFLGLIGILLLSSFYIYDEYSKSENVVFDKILNEGIDLLEDESVNINSKTSFAIEMVRADPVNWDLMFSDLNAELSVQLGLKIVHDFVARYQRNSHSLLDQSIFLVDSILDQIYPTIQDSFSVDEFLKDHCNFLNALDLVRYYQPSTRWDELVEKHSEKLAEYILNQLEAENDFTPKALYLNNSLEQIVNHDVLSPEEKLKLLKHLSPLEPNYNGKISEIYAKENRIQVGRYNSQFTHNGLYQELAYIYASQSDLNKALHCLDTLLVHNQGYYNNTYSFLLDNATNIAYYFLANGSQESFMEFVRAYSNRTGMQVIDFLDQLVGRSIIAVHINVKINNLNLQYLHNYNLQLMSDALRMELFDLYEDEILRIQNPDQRNFKLALLYKHKGLFTAQQQILTSGTYDKGSIESIYNNALDHYNRVSDPFLNQSSQRMYWSARMIQSKRKAQFIFPGYLEYQPIWIRRSYSYHYLNSSFLEYLTSNHLVVNLYLDQDDLNIVDEWTGYLIDLQSRGSFAFFEAEVDYRVIANFVNQLSSKEDFSQEILPRLKILAAIKLFEGEDDSMALKMVEAMVLENLESSLTGNTQGIIETVYRNIGKLGFHLLHHDRSDDYESIIEAFELPTHRASLVAYTASLMGSNQNIEQCRQLIQRAKLEDSKKTSGDGMAPERICMALQLLPKLEGYDESRKIWKNSLFKGFMDWAMARNLSSTGYAWKSYEDIDRLTPPRNRFNLYREIARGIRYSQKKDENAEWTLYDEMNPEFWDPLFYGF